ncbi:MAG: succinyl-CoA synthetase subunit alpha [Thermoplasmata archaeon]|nr:MAG: succinyl-CoA synthetase subunit alpha [Thermoplasmata archaeon]
MSETKEIDKDYEFYLSSDLKEYTGKWIATVEGKIIASGDKADEVMKEAEKKCPNKIIALSKVPTDDLLIL